MTTWKWVVLGVVVVALVVVAWVFFSPSYNGDRGKLERSFTAAERSTIDTVAISHDQLASATCREGAPCWLAVNGVVYDMSVKENWAGGEHHGVRAGTDATEEFVKSGHAGGIISGVPVVGRLVP